MYTEELLSVIPLKKVIGQLPSNVKDISIDSRSVQPKSLFICIKGYTVDGHELCTKSCRFRCNSRCIQKRNFN